MLRREGPYSSQLTTWRKQREKGLLTALAPKQRGRKTDPQAEELARLKRENSMTLAAVHSGRAPALCVQRQQVLQRTYQACPEHFVKDLPKPPAVPTEV